MLRQLANHRRRYAATGKREIQREVCVNQEWVLGPVDNSETPSRELARRERKEALLEALSHLPDHYREVVIEHHQDKLPFEEIGRRRGITDEAAQALVASWAGSGRS